ncbi:hypothetical protein [Streptomyces sp. NRRL S-337]|uniref:hypothetical protein n=1 Tax=Streptomyces sp. NRRL S-337 TaxID=1463900 RepID=UPI0004C813E7|nr:hypothetical protein [Streptomyces sp. NRRL S-337]
MTAGPVSRAVRAAIFAAVCVTIATLGHALMSAQPLPWWAAVAALGITGSAAWWLAGRERGGFVVTGSTVIAQLGLHSLFGLAQSCQTGLDLEAAHAPPPAPSGGMPQMSGLVGIADLPATSAAHMGDMSAMHRGMSQMQVMHSGHGTLGMFLAHALAALLCGLWMWRGEAAAFRLARSVAAALFAPLLLVLTALGRTGLKPTPRPVAGAGHVLHLHGVLLHYALSRRGPPRHLFSC